MGGGTRTSVTLLVQHKRVPMSGHRIYVEDLLLPRISRVALELNIGRRVKDDFLHSDDDASLPPATLVLLMVAT